MKTSSVQFKKNLLHVAVATVLGTSVTAIYSPPALAQVAETTPIEEITVTGSRIMRRDMEVNSPLLTIDRQILEDSAFISVEEALNDLPQFMAGGVGMSANAVTSLQGANGLEGGLGSGDAFNSTLLPNNAQAIGIVVPGAANVNLRGLGANRSLTLIDGHRAMPLNASMIVDLNTIPSIAIGGMEVITGGASAVYGADALAGVTNIKFRENFEGMQVRARGGMNEAGDGDEYQLGALFGANFADGRGNVLVGAEYSQRHETYWIERDHFREVMESPFSDSGDYAFAFDPYYSSGATAGSYNEFQDAYNGGAPSWEAINAVFSDRTCVDGGTVDDNCLVSSTRAPRGGGWYLNTDGTVFTRSSQTGPFGSAVYSGPQGWNGVSDANPDEITCTFTQFGTSGDPNFPGEDCNPTVRRVDYDKWLSGPRDAYNFFGRATYDVTENLEAYGNVHFASSNTFTRREPAPLLGGFGVVIPFDSTEDGEEIYLPSLNPATGATRSQFLAGGTVGTSCNEMGGCTIAQAYPVPNELRTLLESRPGAGPIPTTGLNSDNPFRGLDDCQSYTLATNPDVPGVQVNPESGALYTVDINPDTGAPVAKCGANAGWQLNQQPGWLPPRGTENTAQLYQIAFGLRGDLGISDWTWDLYTSHGAAETQTNYEGFLSIANYMSIITAPNFGQGYEETGPASKFFTCTSGLNPYDPNLQVSEDCVDAITARSIDRNTMKQRIFEISTQGHLMNLPAGEMRGSLGATHRWNGYEFTPDALVDRHYTRDYSAGAFGSGDLSAEVDVNEVYGELLIPLLGDIPLIQSLELELGARYSDYSTGQEVTTYKVLGSWAPNDWMRIRGGYNRAERAPNMSELFATPNGSAQFGSAPVDPCRNNDGLGNSFPAPQGEDATLNNSDTTDPAFREQLQALCSAHINEWGGNNRSEYHGDPDNWDVGGGGALVVGNPDLSNERGDTWTMGVAYTSPFNHELLSRLSGTLDWYSAKVTDPVELLQTSVIVNTCFNQNGLNPGFTLDDPYGYCDLLERDPETGAFSRAYIAYANQGKLKISGVDLSLRWNADMSELGLGRLPGSLSISTNMNFLLEQTQRYGVEDLGDYAGYSGAAEFRANTGFTYAWDRHRITLLWNYRAPTDTPTTFSTAENAAGSQAPDLQRNAERAGYKAVNLFNLTAGTQIANINASLTISNLLDRKPRPGGYLLEDPRQGFGSFSPFDDLVGRRYSFNLSADF